MAGKDKTWDSMVRDIMPKLLPKRKMMEIKRSQPVTPRLFSPWPLKGMGSKKK